jgi:4-amino-4-deoxy-L-arabinose transferase-like glycosyltransferase
MKANAVLLMLALLGIYVAITLSASNDVLQGDEGRYVSYARNLRRGAFTTNEAKYLWNGPGYPLVLMPFGDSGIPLIWAKLLNCLFMLGTTVFVYLLLCRYMSRQIALAGALITGLYGPLLVYMPRLLTESLSVFLVAGFSYFTVMYFASGRKRYCWGAGAFCGYLMLTKVLFAYVSLAGLAAAIVLWTMRRQSGRMVKVYAIAFLVCVPYLYYTWSLTGKVFYWSNAGGTSLYCMAVRSEKGYGDWNVFFGPEGREKHSKLMAKLEGLDYVERDEFLKREAIEHMKRDPGTYLANLVSNAGRLWYNYPYTNKLQRPGTLVIMVPNSMLLLSLLACVYPIVRRRRLIPPELGWLMLFAATYLAGTLLLFACDRYLLPVLPILLVTVLFAATSLVSMRLKSDSE